MIKLNKALNASFLLFRKGSVLGLLFFLFTQASFAQPDKQVFDLNDPRNPDCPCHKYQKMADEEFEQLQKKNKLNTSIDLAELAKDPNLAVNERQLEETKVDIHRPHSQYSKKKSRKVFKKRMHKQINLFSLRSSKAKRFKPCYSVCFKW